MAEESTKAATLTYEKFNEKLIPQNIIASAQAITNLSDSLKNTVETLEKADKAASGWNRFIDGFKTLYGGDLQSKFAESLGAQVEAGLKSITDPKLKAEAESKLRELLQVDEFTAASIEKAAGKIDSSKIIGLGKEVASVFGNISTQSQKSAAALVSVQEGFKNLDTSYQNLVNSLNVSDPLIKFGVDLSQQGFKLAEVFKDPIAGAAQLRDILTDVSKIKLLSPESQAILIQNKQAFIDLSNQLAVFEKQVEDSNKRLIELRKFPRRNAKKIEEEEVKLGSARSGAQDISLQLQTLTKTISSASTESIIRGFTIVEAGFSRAIQTGILTQQKTLLDKLPKTPESIMLGAKLENRKIDLQIDQIKQTERLIKEMELTRLSAERIAIESQRDMALGSTTEPNLRASISRSAEEKLAPILQREAVLKSTNISGDIRKGKIERTPEALAELQRRSGAIQKITDLADQQQLNLINAQIESISARYEKEQKGADRELKDLESRKQLYISSQKFQDDTLATRQEELKIFDDEKQKIERRMVADKVNQEQEVAFNIRMLALGNNRKGTWAEIAELARVAGQEAAENGAITIATNKLKTEQENLTTRQKGYEEIFKNSLNSMSDALIEFAMTGKLNFSDMVNSMVRDIIRLEMRMQFQQVYMGMRSGFLSMFAADGAAFDTGGVQKFARGGAFTNQIVNEPVLFKFAQGTGMMGEAGPEAIMPLTRDSQGNLGVRNSTGSSGKVDVIINNYSGQQVEQQQTIDTRGNRRVEVTIGDINAGEVSRTGSSTQRAISSSFGLQPTLIRR